MSQSRIIGFRIADIATCVPGKVFRGVEDAKEFGADEVRKVVGKAGVERRHVADETICSTDPCYGAAEALLDELDYDRESIDTPITVTQTQDYIMPSSSCLLQGGTILAPDVARIWRGPVMGIRAHVPWARRATANTEWGDASE